ncbi:MAG: hypothetical protein Q7R66_02430 [Undibacterium sp.]|uniref:DUF6622 family protein n=1 Tax=Undibacterium sp. TaxID=1914977 RepID=UPI0027212594|nr:DUF6622 family protein [Undibacterium sp.]MDO8651029.1 hypothetical protein [Undibacterium sp.]
MINQILANTPRWVWFLLAALLWLGLSQTRSRTATLQRITLMPLAMTGLSLSGTLAAFGADPQVVLAWLVAVALMAFLVQSQTLPASTHYDPATRLFSLPGSWVPLLLIMGIFMTKYVVGVLTAMQPALSHEAGFRLGFAILYGAFSGVFLARAVRLWRLVLSAGKGAVQPEIQPAIQAR